MMKWIELTRFVISYTFIVSDTKSVTGGTGIQAEMESEDVTNGNANENKPPVNFILGGENEPEIHIEEDDSEPYIVGGKCFVKQSLGGAR